MRLDQLRDYLTMAEIAQRWKATDPEMCRAILKGLLRPSLYLNASLCAAEVDQAGGLVASDSGPEQVAGWHYVTHIQQVGALDCRASAVAVLHDEMPGASIWLLPEPMSMADLLREAVVMAEDLIGAERQLEEETHWQQRSAKTKEFNSVLNILSITLADAYRYDPRVRSSILREITDAGVEQGIPVSLGTVSKWAQEAIEQFPPRYMHELVDRGRRQRDAA